MPTWMQHVLEYVACGVAFAVAYHSLNDDPKDYIGFRSRSPWARFSLFSRRLSSVSRRSWRPPSSPRLRVRRRF